jgi:hypothetical protein
MKLIKFALLQAIVVLIIVTLVFNIESDADRNKKRKMKINKSYMKNLQDATNVDEKKVMIYRVLSYDSKLSLILIDAGLLPNGTSPDSASNTNIINQLREFMHNFNDTASLQDTKGNFDKSLTDGFKVLKDKYKFEYKSSAAPAPAAKKK